MVWWTLCRFVNDQLQIRKKEYWKYFLIAIEKIECLCYTLYLRWTLSIWERSLIYGENLKGKECGKGIYHRKDGSYSARYYTKSGKRKEKSFQTLPEAKNWLADAKYVERHNLIVTSPDMTVDKWFSYWIGNIVCDLAPNTKRNYQERHKWNIHPAIRTMCIADVKPMHCKAVLNRMEATYAGSTIRQAYITTGTMLKSAVMKILSQNTQWMVSDIQNQRGR